MSFGPGVQDLSHTECLRSGPYDSPVPVPKAHSAKHRASKKAVLGGETQDTNLDPKLYQFAGSCSPKCKKAPKSLQSGWAIIA